MQRIARGIIADIPYHVIHRGNNRQKIFFSESDYNHFLKLLYEAKQKYPCKIYSYVVMPNHFHILLESFHDPENLAKFIKLAAQKYTQYINKNHKRTGTLWEGRFKSSPVSNDDYLLACSRYIELNPVRAKMVRIPEEYKWSSCRFKVGGGDSFRLLDNDPLYLEMGKDDNHRQANYKKWLHESIPDDEWDSIRQSLNKGGVFGALNFKEKLEGLLGRSYDIRERGRPPKNNK